MSKDSNFRLLGAKATAGDRGFRNVSNPDAVVVPPTPKDTAGAAAAGKVVGTLLGTLIGAYFGGPEGAQIGGAAGAKSGEGVGSIVGGGDVQDGLKKSLVPDASTLRVGAAFAAKKAEKAGGAKADPVGE